MVAPAEELDRIARVEHRDPHRILGRHLEGGRVVYRYFHRGIDEVTVVRDHWSAPMQRVHPGGVFELVTDQKEIPPPGGYRIELTDAGRRERFHDPYAFSPTVGELDMHLFGEGKHRELYRVLGAHVREHQGARGTSFVVWAPQAERVSVVGDFNHWDGSRHAMRLLEPGVWEIFVPGVDHGALYKFEILTAQGALLVKADPYGVAMELRPNTASKVYASTYRWEDDAWLERRATRDTAREPMSVYEVHLGSWRHRAGPPEREDQPNWLSYRELAIELVDYVAELGFTHVELMPVMEHPYDGSWGYQVGGYYAPTSRYGSPDDLRFFVDTCHQRGIGVIVDWVPAHFPKDAFALGRFDGTALYEHIDPRQGEHRQWGTYVFNYGRPEVVNFLIGNALYWIDELHVDGLRADAVASMLYLDYAAKEPHEWQPNIYGGRENIEAIELIRALNDAVHERHPGFMVIAEESTAWPGVTHSTRAGGLGFDFKWNMGWMHDTLRYFSKDGIHRGFHHGSLTFGLWYAFSEKFILPLSHDEVVHMKKSLLAKMAGDRWRMFANLRALYAHMWAHPGKKLLFMGGEIGQWREWSEVRELDWEVLDGKEHVGLQKLIKDLNRLYVATPALFEADHEPRGFKWIDCNDVQHSVISFLRFPAEPETDGDYLLVVGNFTPVPRIGYRVGVPVDCTHVELLNTDARDYGGSGMGNMGRVLPSAIGAHGYEHSLELTLPPLSVLWLQPRPRAREAR